MMKKKKDDISKKKRQCRIFDWFRKEQITRKKKLGLDSWDHQVDQSIRLVFRQLLRKN